MLNQFKSETSPTPSSSSTSIMKSTAKKPGQVMADAAATAEFNEKRWFWLPDEKLGYIAGWILKDSSSTSTIDNNNNNQQNITTENSSIVEVRCVDDKIRSIKFDLLEKMNPPKFDRVEDIGELTFLNEPSVVHNLRQRYESKMIYTYSGLFLVAINPYHPLPIYTPQVIAQYKNKRREENPPHVYAVAERSWQYMLGERENQSILITGESGAGKTENTKRVISYLTAIASTHKSNDTSDSSLPRSGSNSKINSINRVEVSDLVGKRLGKLERQILQANPIMESFGNAQTVRNNNSSRFGKFVRIEFNALGAISGANIDWYLLEKSRVTSRSEKERAFHIFYQLLIGISSISSGGGGEEQLAERLLLSSTDPKDYDYLSKSKLVVDGMNDLDEWRTLRESLNVVGLSQDEQFDLFKIISIILHIGNIIVHSDRSDVAYIQTSKDQDSLVHLEKAFHLLGLPNLEEFKKSVLRPKIKAGRELVTQQRNAKQVKEELSSLCTTLYEKSFGKLIDKINMMLDKNQKGLQNSLSAFKSTFIGVLDIAGFEIFEINGFEQLCINYTNERLQQFFNHHMFVLEQEEYSKEDIDWDFVNFGLDLQPTIALIESTYEPIGILSCLDEECIMPRATDVTFTDKLIGLMEKNANPKFIKSRFNSSTGFIIQHYAGQVEYRTEGWLEKNKDPLNNNLTNVLASSNDKFIASLFEEYRDDSNQDLGLATRTATATSSDLLPTGPMAIGKRRVVKRGAFRTVGQRHKEQLTSLMNQLQSTQPHFVRCIVPNPDKRPGVIDVKLVLDQLRCNGVLEGIRIARLGYPNRLPFIEFRQRYEVLTPGIIPSGYLDGRKACIRMLGALELDESVFRIGLTKVFFKSGVLAELEERRDEYLYEIFTNLQANCRSFIHQRKMKKILNKAMSIRAIQRNARIYNELKSWPWWQLYTRVRPLLAATRDDQELRKKAHELNQLKEKNEKERLERERLEAVKKEIEIEKQKVENELEQERLVSLNKEEQLIRSKEMEMALIDELETTRKELEVLEDQLENELKLHHSTKSVVNQLTERKDELTNEIKRLENDDSKLRENEEMLKTKLLDQQRSIDRLEQEKTELNRSFEDLKRQQAESEEDVVRSEKRMKMVIAELEGKLEFENEATQKLKARIESLEKECINSKIQLGEMKKTIIEYESKLKHKDAEAVGLENQRSMVVKEKELSQKRAKELELKIESLEQQLSDSKHEILQHVLQHQEMTKELDETRALLETKCSEEDMAFQISKTREEELNKFRDQQLQLLSEMSEIKRQGNETVAKIKSERDEVRQLYQTANQSHREALQQVEALSQKLSNLELVIQKTDRAKQVVEIELQNVRSKHLESTDGLTKLTREKESLEKQLVASNLKFQDMEDAMLKIERERSAWSRQVGDLKSKLESELLKRVELETESVSLEKDLKIHKDAVSEHEKNAASLRKELTIKNQELQKAISLQDKTIVEHVHVLEEAKKYTDRQLNEANALLREQTGQLKLLDRTVARLKGEAEDLNRELQKEKVKNRQTIFQQRKVSGANDLNEINSLKLNLDKEKLARTEAESAVRKLQSELQATKHDTSAIGMKKHYENRIADLERQLNERDTNLNKATVDRVKKQVEQRYNELIDLVNSADPTKSEDGFRNKLLIELHEANQELENEIALSLDSLGRPVVEKMKAYSNGTSFKRNHAAPGSVARMSRELDQNAQVHDRSKVVQLEDTIRKYERANHLLQADLQVLHMQQLSSDVIRKHLESQLDDMLRAVNDSNQSLTMDEVKTRLNLENERLQELLREEVEARSRAEHARLRGSQTLKELQNTITNGLDDRFSKLESTQINLLSQNRLTSQELTNQKTRINELEKLKASLETELMDYKERCEQYAHVIEQESEEKRQMLAELQEAQIERASSGDLENALASWKQKADSYRDRVEAAEVARLKAEKSETFAKVSLADAERRRAEAAEDREAAEQRAREAEQKVRELEAYLEDEGGDFTKAQREAQRTLAELNELKSQYDRAMSERDYTVEATRQRFQQELESLAAELEMERERTMRVREEARQLRVERDELQIRNDERLYSRGGFSKEKERLETKILDVMKAYDEAVAVQAEQSSQIVTLMSQVRDLRAARDEAEADRAALVTAKKSLEQRLEEIGSEYLSANSGRLTNDRVLQTLQQERGELKRQLEEKEDMVAVALERQKKAEAFANDCQIEANRERLESTELLKANTDLEKKIKSLNLKIVDLETRSMTSSPLQLGPHRMVVDQKHYEELMNQLEVEKQNVAKATRKSERSIEDLQIKLLDAEKSKNRLQDEMSSFENKILGLRKQNSDLQSSESELQLAKRRAEREATDLKEKMLRLQAELERYRSKGALNRSSPAPPNKLSHN